MTAKIFRSAFFTSFIVLAVSAALIMWVLFGVFENLMQNELVNEADYIQYAIGNDAESFFDTFQSRGKRVTLISQDGTVLYDTEADPKTMDNHAGRREFKEALQNGEGKSVRYSQTFAEKTVYYARRLENGDVLRVSAKRYTAAVFVLRLTQPLGLIMLIALVLSFILSSRVAKSVIKPINEINLDNPEECECYDEMTPLLKRLAKQKKTIAKQLADAHQMQENFRLITENMSEGFLVIDAKTNLLSYNSAALKLLNSESSDCRESVLALNRSEAFRNAISEVLQGTRSEQTMTENEQTYNLIATPVFEKEKVIGAVIIILDVTESARREALRREFTANVSHELKTPLTSISGFAELMCDGTTPPEVTADFAKSIYSEAQRLIALVSDIIKISRLDEGTGGMEVQPVDMLSAAQSQASVLKTAADKKNVKINVSGTHKTVNGVRTILDEMIYNLCDNAVKYNKNGGSVDVTVSGGDNNVTVTVKDTGIGIPQAYQSRVFERFFRVDKSRSKAGGGTGLGLSIVKHGAKLHNADIVLESTEGEGTTVKLIFAK